MSSYWTREHFSSFNSIGACVTMSEDNEQENDSESLEELAKQKLKKDLGKNESLEDVKTERDELKSRLTILALKEFENEVEKTIAKLPKEKQEKAREVIEQSGDKPSTLESFKAQILVNEPETDDGTEPLPAQGVVKAYKPAQKETVEDLYDILTSNTSTIDEKRVADKKLDLLWKKSLSDKKKARRTIRELTEEE